MHQFSSSERNPSVSINALRISALLQKANVLTGIEKRNLRRQSAPMLVIVAAADARFSTPFVALGLTPEAASSLKESLGSNARLFQLGLAGAPPRDISTPHDKDVRQPEVRIGPA
jgi:hypothetical protein